MTIMLSSHHLREVEDVCTRVGMIDSGRTVLEGSVPELLLAAGDELKVICSAPNKAADLLAEFPGIRLGTVTSGPNNVQAQLDPGCALEVLLKNLIEENCGVVEFFRERASLVDVFQNAIADSNGEANASEVAA